MAASKNTREQCRALARYILSLPGTRYLTFSYYRPFEQRQYCFPEKISREQRQYAPDDLFDMLMEGARRGAGLVLRIQNQVHGKDVLNGFTLSRNGIVKISAERMRWAQETMPDGTRRPDPTAVYQVAFVDLPMAPD